MLNDTLIRSLKASDKPQKHFDGGGLYLFIPTTGSKLWRMAYRFDKKTKLLSLREYPAVSLKDARERREEAKKLLAQDIDPSLHKKALRDARLTEAANTFQDIVLEWHENKATDFTEKHRDLSSIGWKTRSSPLKKRFQAVLNCGSCLWFIIAQRAKRWYQ